MSALARFVVAAPRSTAPRPLVPRGPAADVAALGVRAALLVGTTVLALDGVLPAEEALFRAVHALPDALEPVLWAPMQLGSGLAPLVVGPLLGWATGDWRPAVGAVVVGVGGWWAAKGVKALVGRGRPGAELTGVDRRRGTPRDGTGFLSGHAAVAFGLLAVARPHLTPAGAAVAYGLVGLVGLGRVHVGAHLPLDIVGGAALGGLLGGLWSGAVDIAAVLAAGHESGR